MGSPCPCQAEATLARRDRQLLRPKGLDLPLPFAQGIDDGGSCRGRVRCAGKAAINEDRLTRSHGGIVSRRAAALRGDGATVPQAEDIEGRLRSAYPVHSAPIDESEGVVHRNPIGRTGYARGLSASGKAALGGGCGLTLALLLLTVHVFLPREILQLAAIGALAAASLCFWVAVLLWRMPVLGRGMLVSFAVVWICGIAVSVGLALHAAAGRSIYWQRSVQCLSLALSFAVGALLLRALLHRRATPLLGRLLSFLSPLAILLLILFLPSAPA